MPSSALSPAPPAKLRAALKERFRAAVPLRARMRMAVVVGRSRLPGAEWWSAELVRDLAERDLNAYHRFLWSNHLAYARTYEPEARFGDARIHPTRHLLFAVPDVDLSKATAWLERIGRGNAAAFDHYGWQYYVRSYFDLISKEPAR